MGGLDQPLQHHNEGTSITYYQVRIVRSRLCRAHFSDEECNPWLTVICGIPLKVVGRGERIWVLAMVSNPISVKGVDKIEKYLLLSNGHDGRTSLQMRFTPIWVVCQNTLSAALASGGDLFKSYHDSRMRRKLEDAQQAVKRIMDYYDDLGQKFNAFADKQMTTDLVTKYVQAVFPEPKRKRGESDRRYEMGREEKQPAPN